MKAVHRDHFFLIRGRDHLGSYKWNKNIAEHFFCRFCGVYTHHKRRRYPEQMVSNFACLDDTDLPSEEEIATVDGASHD